MASNNCGSRGIHIMKFVDMISSRLTERELSFLNWEEDGKIYSFREWMRSKYKDCVLGMSEDELEREVIRIVRQYRGY